MSISHFFFYLSAPPLLLRLLLWWKSLHFQKSLGLESRLTLALMTPVEPQRKLTFWVCSWLTILSCSISGHFRFHGAERDVGVICSGININRVALGTNKLMVNVLEIALITKSAVKNQLQTNKNPQKQPAWFCLMSKINFPVSKTQHLFNTSLFELKRKLDFLLCVIIKGSMLS